jgi:splicing factor 1
MYNERITTTLTHLLCFIGPRKRRSRWGDEKVDSGITTAIGSNVSQAELERYALNVRIEEIAKKLRTGDFVPPERERSPSPPPTYDGQGRRTNTREVRYRKKLEDERVRLVDKQIKLDPNYRPPAEYAAAKRNLRPQEKVYLPIKEFPEINFFGLLVGPRGNSLKQMERESGAKISIRGRGSVKEGKGRMGDEDEEEMHCVVTGDDETKVKRCVKLINLVIETAASTPEAQNDHKRNQLRELAALNGTLRDDENQVCQNCGEKGHRKFECPEQRNWTAHIVCHRCGQQGHLARDCTQGGGPGMGRPGMGGPGPGAGGPGPGGANGTPFDSEYANLMAELGEGGKSGPGTGAPATDRPLGPDGKKIPPWRDPSVWISTPFGGQRGPRFGMGAQGQYGQQQYGGYDYQQQQAGGQPDYREAWIQYYIQQGMDPTAAAAAATAAAAGGGGGQEQQQQQQPQQAGQAQQDYSKEWEEWVQ